MNRIGHSRWPSWYAAVITGLLLRGVWMMFVQPEPIADFAFYYTRAAELAGGLGYRYQGHPTAFFPVGTSLILAGPFALLGASIALAKLLSLAAWTISIVLTFKLGMLVTGPRASLIGALIVALHPDFIAFSALVASENFFVPLLLASLYVLCVAARSTTPRFGLIAASAVLFGGALLVRSTVLILLPLFALLLVWRPGAIRSGVIAAVIFGGTTALVLTPWIARNAVSMGQPLLTTNGGIALWWGNNPHASGGFPLSIDPPTQNISTVGAEVANNARLSNEAFDFIRTHPLRWLELAPAKLGYLFTSQSSDIGFSLRNRYVGGPWAIEYHPRLGDPSNAELAAYVERDLGTVENRMIGAYYHLAGGALSMLLQGGLWIAGMVGLALVWLRERRHGIAGAVLVLVPLAWLLFHVTLGNGQPRYLMPLAPLMAIGTGNLLIALQSLWRRQTAPHPFGKGDS